MVINALLQFITDRETTDNRIVLQHQRPMGDPQVLTETAEKHWAWSVWRGMGGSVEQHHPCRHQNSETRSVPTKTAVLDS